MIHTSRAALKGETSTLIIDEVSKVPMIVHEKWTQSLSGDVQEVFIETIKAHEAE